MKKSETQLLYPFEGTPSSPDFAIVDIGTTGRFWRTSDLTFLTVIRPAGQPSFFHEITLFPEQSSDEYDILKGLGGLLGSSGRIITFNGHSFDLPYLTAKLAAYGLPDPFTGRAFRDLYTDFRPLKAFLGLRRARLTDFFSFIASGSSHEEALQPFRPGLYTDDASRTLILLSLDSFLQLGDPGKLRLLTASCAEDGSRLEYCLSADSAFPVHYTLSENDLELFADGKLVRLSIPVAHGTIRVYHTDVKNYVYLPEEGYAVHRSIASFMDPSRKEKAVRENCFHLIPYSDRLLTDDPQTIGLISSALHYLLQRPDPYKPSRN